MSDEKPVAEGGHGHTIKVFEDRVVIKYNIFKSVTIPIKRIDQVDVSRLSNRLTIKTDKEKHTISMGTPGKAKEVADAIMARL